MNFSPAIFPLFCTFSSFASLHELWQIFLLLANSILYTVLSWVVSLISRAGGRVLYSLFSLNPYILLGTIYRICALLTYALFGTHFAISRSHFWEHLQKFLATIYCSKFVVRSCSTLRSRTDVGLYNITYVHLPSTWRERAAPQEHRYQHLPWDFFVMKSELIVLCFVRTLIIVNYVWRNC